MIATAVAAGAGAILLGALVVIRLVPSRMHTEAKEGTS
jgi:hypothetical protein